MGDKNDVILETHFFTAKLREMSLYSIVVAFIFQLLGYWKFIDHF